MDIIFVSKKFEKQCNRQRLLVQQQGEHRAKIIKRRLDDLRAVKVLEEMRDLPGRCHELSGERFGQFSLDLDHRYRLIIRPAKNPIPRKSDGGLDWTRITVLAVIGVEDTHE